jgi:ubiquinone biosynthesis monooxygenase Coq7
LAGFALGAGSALLGSRAAMACTVGVEEVIDAHYRAQAERLGDAEPALRQRLLAFRADELRHRDAALTHGAAESLGFELVSAVSKAGSRLAIWLSTRF